MKIKKHNLFMFRPMPSDQFLHAHSLGRGLRRLLRGVLVVVAGVASSAWAEPSQSGDELEAILGISWPELMACNVDSDCVVINSFVHCCERMSIGKRYQGAVSKKQKELWQKLAPPEVKRFCSLVECTAPDVQARCQQDQCTSVAVPKR
jgi:hypothetical protein